MGMIAFAFKEMVDVAALSDYVELFVGLTLIIIGVSGYHEATTWLKQMKKDEAIHLGNESDKNTQHVQVEIHTAETYNDHHACHTHSHHTHHGHSHASHQNMKGWGVVCTGIVHGFSGSGHLLGVLPALSLGDWWSASAYLLCFCLGTMGAMGVFTGTIGYLSLISNQAFKRADLSARLALLMSYVAIGLGIVMLKPLEGIQFLITTLQGPAL